MSRRPSRPWVGTPRTIDPTELVGPRGLTEELLAEPEDAGEDRSSSEGDAAPLARPSEPEHTAELNELLHRARSGLPIAASTPGEQAALDAFHRSLLSEQRLARIESVIAARLSSVTVVLDRLLDAHNVAAILRSAEGMGIGSAHVIVHAEGDPGAHRRVTRDADKWLEVTPHPTGADCARTLVQRGFAVYAGHLAEDSLLVSDLPVDRPLALLFGNEHEGPSPETLAACTGSFRIPMAGFTQSFNVSVAAAIALFGAVQRRRALLGAPGDLDEPSRSALRSRFLRLGAKLARRIRRARAP